MARVGGSVFPKQLQQFEAVGINNGPDGKPDTADDLNLGIVDVKWSLEEYTATFGDDDLQFVGALDQNGLFTPNVDGPNPKRSGNRNNVGDVWVVAELDPAAGTGSPGDAKARAAARPRAPARDRSALHGLVRDRGGTMTALGRARTSSLRGGGEAVRLPGAERGDLRAGRRGRRRAADAHANGRARARSWSRDAASRAGTTHRTIVGRHARRAGARARHRRGRTRPRRAARRRSSRSRRFR